MAMPLNAGAMRKVLFADTIPITELWRTYYGRSVDLQRIENAIRNAQLGAMKDLTDLARETMEVDPHLGMLGQKRFGAVSVLDHDIVPATGPGVDDKRAQNYAAVVRDQIARIPSFKSRLFDLAWGFYDNRAALEIQWRGPLPGPVRWEPLALGWIHPRRISYGPEREFRIIDALYSTAYFPSVGEALRDWPFKFIEFRPRLFGDYPEREGLALRSLYWSFFKRFGQRERLILTELYGKPWRIVEADKDAPEPGQKEDFDRIDQQVAALGGNNIARLPRGFKLNVEHPAEKGGEIHGDLVKESDDQLSKLWVGQTMTSDAKPGDGIGSKQAEVHADQQALTLKRDAYAISEAIEDYLTDAIVVLNFGWEALSHAPKFVLRADPEEDRTVQIDRIDKAVRAGVPIALEQAYELSGFRSPEPGEPQIVFAVPTNETTARPMLFYPGGAPAGALPEPPPPPAPAAPAAPGGAEPGAEGEPAPDDAEEPPAEPIRIANSAPMSGAEFLDAIHEALPDAFADLTGVLPGDEPAHVHLAARQPETIHGSPEPIVDKGVREAARELGRWAERLTGSLSGNANAILRRLQSAAAALDMHPLARIAERRMMHSLMLGALDANYESATDDLVKPETFASIAPVPIEPTFVHKPYESALRFFKAKKVVDRATFEELSNRAKARAFTVARMASHDMLETVKAELYKQIGEGADLKEFKKFAKARLESAGWVPANASHVETIFRTNVLNAYGAGRHAEMTQPTVLKLRPYWQILGIDDSRTRDTHKAVHNWVLRADDPIWKTAYPPWGFNCRCRARSLSPELVQKLGLQIRSGADMRNLPDEGFVSGTGSLLAP